MGMLVGMQDALHSVSQALLIPTIGVLLLLLLGTVVCIGSVLAEAITERRYLKDHVPQLVESMHGKTKEEMISLVEESGLLRRQKKTLQELLQYHQLPEEERRAIAKKLIAASESFGDRRIGVTEIISRIGPMFGLMGTLIPLGPGIIALGQGDTVTLSTSLLVAFDTTIAGLISAAICFVITKIRCRWYENDMVSLESMMECILEEVK
jgi:biopolymer transport protein ExbB/TolQ